MKLQELHTMTLLEGGEVFKNADGTSRTQRINLADIKPTLVWLSKVSGLPTLDMTLGSVGKKTSSGDLDIAVDANLISKDQLISRLSQWVQSQNQDPKQYVKKSGISVHFLTPIRGDEANGFVQVDWMFDQDPKWLKFGMFSAGDNSKYTGADRNLLMSSVAKALGMKYSWQKGLIRRDDESLISKDPDQIAKKMFGAQYNKDVFLSVETLQDAIHKTPKLVSAFKKLVQDLPLEQNPDGTPRKPGDIRKNQEEAMRITRLTGIS